MADNKMKTGVYTYNDNEFAFNFSTSLSPSEKIYFVNGVVDTVVGDDYNLIIKDLMFDYMIVSAFTDVDIKNIVDVDIDKIEEFLNDTNIVEIVETNADDGVIRELIEAVEMGIEYRTGIHKSLIEESISSLLNTIESKINSIDLEGMSDAIQMLSGISGEFTTDKVIEAYANSDIFKNQYRQLVEDRAKHNEKIDEITKDFKVVKSGKQSAHSPLLSPTV